MTEDLNPEEKLNATGQKLPTDEDVVAPEEDESAKPIVVSRALPEASTFDELGLAPELIAATAKLNWTAPTKIQGMCLPYTLSGRDLAGFAQTGTGKTGVFLITIAHRVSQLKAKHIAAGTKMPHPFAIVLSPTRELAMQIEHDAQALFEQLGISSLAVFGGVEYDKQAKSLDDGIDVIVATPGRLKDFTQKKVVDVSNTQIFICDEADRMFDMGFIDDVEFFLDKLSETSQKLLFSATTNEKVNELAFEYLNKPEYISAQPESITPENITQRAIICESVNKLKVMLSLLRQDTPNCAIVFTNTKAAAEWLQFKLNGNGLDTDLITGDLPQRKRIALIKRIKAGEVKALIATDVASRGLHISGVTHVYNFDLPNDASNYVHRIGRTARAGAKGTATSLVCEDYGENLQAINQLLGQHAMKSEWYDPEFLQVEDNAGVPPRSQNNRGRERDGGDRGRGRTGSQGPRRQDQRGGRDQGRGRPEQRPSTLANSRQGARGPNDNRRNGPRPQAGNGNRTGDRHQNYNRGEQRPNRPNQPRQQQRPQQPRPQNQRPAAAAASTQSTGFIALVRKLFSTVFGGSDKK